MAIIFRWDLQIQILGRSFPGGGTQFLRWDPGPLCTLRLLFRKQYLCIVMNKNVCA